MEGSGGNSPNEGMGGHHHWSDATKGLFAAAAEAKRAAQEKMISMQQEQQRQREQIQQQLSLASGTAAVGATVNKATSSQFGKPIGQARSSLTSRLHGRVLGVASPIPPATVTSTATAATAASSTLTTGTVADPTKRRILYAGIAPGSTQVPSSINAVTGVHPNFIGEDAARAVAVAEDEQKRMDRLEENAARVALGATASVKPAAEVAARTAAPTTKIKSPLEGPAMLAAGATPHGESWS